MQADVFTYSVPSNCMKQNCIPFLPFSYNHCFVFFFFFPQACIFNILPVNLIFAHQKSQDFWSWMNTIQRNNFFRLIPSDRCTYILFTWIGWQVSAILILVKSFFFFFSDNVKICKGNFSWFISTLLMKTYKAMINLRNIT